MKNALKQLFLGSFLSIMTISMTLMPIPRFGIVYAQGVNQEDCYDPEKDGEENRLYKPGCKLDGIIKKTKFGNYTDHQSSITAILEQAVAGMMGVVMIQSLTHGYLYEVDPMLYGNDCAANKAGKYTLRIAQLGSLAYILGDIKANMDFKKASQKATDNAFSAPTNVPAGADAVQALDHKNEQIKSFDTLIEVFEAQKKGIKSKQALSLLAEGAYGASLGLE
ncbi:MAG: hypothetical protein KC478_09370, partial [Bacteriovoracaceae bacterium]|nr:hypothetical protein [Bacteriovoracaceae bacterium]